MNSRKSKEREPKACKTCAKAKVRCEMGTGRDRCSRCHRLDKPCEIQEPGAHRSVTRTRTRATHNAVPRLEPGVESGSEYLMARSSPSLLSVSPSPIADSLFGNALSPSGFDMLDQMIPPDGNEAALLFAHYRAHMAPLCPFVVIHDSITPTQLRHEKPLLYMALIMVAYQTDVDRQSDIARLVRYEVSQATLFRSEKSVAVLQALVILVTWNQSHIHLGGQLLNYLHISSAMLVELGIDKEANSHSKTSVGAFGDLGREGQVERARSLDERRVFLGVYWVNTIIKSCLKDIVPLRFTRYADQCSQTLESTMEYLTDAYLLRLVHIQRKIERIRDMVYSDDTAFTSGMSVSLIMGVSALDQELQALEATLPAAIGAAQLLHLSHKSVMLYLRKISLDDRLFQSPPSPIDGNTTRHSMFRTELLLSCLATINSLMTLVFALPVDLMLSMPYLCWAQIAHAIVILTRLSDVRHETWDATYVSSVLDLRATYIKFADKVDEVMVAGGRQRPPRNLPAIFRSMVIRLRELGASPSGGSWSFGGDGGFILDENTLNNIFFDMLNVEYFG